MTTMIDPDELLSGLEMGDHEDLTAFVAAELNVALAFKIPLNGRSWITCDKTCGCLIANAAIRRGLAPDYYDMGNLAIDFLTDIVDVTSHDLSGVATGFTQQAAINLQECSDLGALALADFIDEHGPAITIGARAYTLFQERGGTIVTHMPS